MSQSDTGYNVWGVIASILSLLAFISAIVNGVPIVQARIFDSTLVDTQCVLYGFVEDGCLDDIFIAQAICQLSRLQADASRVIDSYRTGNIAHQIMGLICLKSFKLRRIRVEVEGIRTTIKGHAAEALGLRIFENAVEPSTEQACLSSDESNLIPSVDSTFQDENTIEKALDKTYNTQDAPEYYAEFLDKTQHNTPKRRGFETKLKGALKKALSFGKRR